MTQLKQKIILYFMLSLVVSYVAGKALKIDIKSIPKNEKFPLPVSFFKNGKFQNAQLVLKDSGDIIVEIIDTGEVVTEDDFP